MKFNIDTIASDKYFNYSYLYQYIYFYITILGIRCKYYAVWCINEGSVSLSGLSYNGRYTEKTKVS